MFLNLYAVYIENCAPIIDDDIQNGMSVNINNKSHFWYALLWINYIVLKLCAHRLLQHFCLLMFFILGVFYCTSKGEMLLNLHSQPDPRAV